MGMRTLELHVRSVTPSDGFEMSTALVLVHSIAFACSKSFRSSIRVIPGSSGCRAGSSSCSTLLAERDLSRKPGSTFRDHAQAGDASGLSFSTTKVLMMTVFFGPFLLPAWGVSTGIWKLSPGLKVRSG